MLSSLLYVSTSRLEPAMRAREMASIVEASRGRNTALGVTGALILARGHFAQNLEGDRPALDELMKSIRQDARHTRVNVVEYRALAERRFPQWSMAYAGEATYIDRCIAPLLPALQEAETRRAKIQRLIVLMRELVAGGDA